MEILQVPSLGLVKTSFILLYRRIFTKSTAPIFNWITWSILFLIVGWTIGFFFSIVFICGTDFSAYWTSTVVEKAHCVDTSMLHNAFAISDVVTDAIIITLPLPMVGHHLHTSLECIALTIYLLPKDLANTPNDSTKTGHLRNLWPWSPVSHLYDSKSSRYGLIYPKFLGCFNRKDDYFHPGNFRSVCLKVMLIPKIKLIVCSQLQPECRLRAQVVPYPPQLIQADVPRQSSAHQASTGA